MALEMIQVTEMVTPLPQSFKDEMECGLVMAYQEMIEIYKQQNDTAGVARVQADLEKFLLNL